MPRNIFSDAVEAAEQIRNVDRKKEIAEMERLTFGKERAINVLLLTTRLFEAATTLRDYLSSSTDINVFYSIKVNEAIEIAEKENIDFFVLVGRLENLDDFNIIKGISDITTIVFYAIPSSVVMEESKIFRIEYIYDRSRKMSDFVDYLRQIYDKDKIATMEIQKIKRNERIAKAEKKSKQRCWQKFKKRKRKNS